jgi:hypothetical protein
MTILAVDVQETRTEGNYIQIRRNRGASGTFVMTRKPLLRETYFRAGREPLSIAQMLAKLL